MRARHKAASHCHGSVLTVVDGVNGHPMEAEKLDQRMIEGLQIVSETSCLAIADWQQNESKTSCFPNSVCFFWLFTHSHSLIHVNSIGFIHGGSGELLDIKTT